MSLTLDAGYASSVASTLPRRQTLVLFCRIRIVADSRLNFDDGCFERKKSRTSLISFAICGSLTISIEGI